jgi:hypothetical protein
MARISNPLDQFQSHSIHYVMLASRTTDAIRDFTLDTPTMQTQSLQAIDAAQHIGDEVRLSSSSSVYLMIDTRRFSQFTVENFELETAMTGFAVPGSKSPASTALDMKFTILDSTGISFANFLQHLMDEKLQVSYDGMTVLVRLLFIGHRPDGTTEVVQSLTIPAIFKQIQVDLNEVKGVYTCSLFPMIGMASNAGYNSKWTNIGTASSYFSGASENTLGAVVNSFERRLNEYSASKYIASNAEVQSGGMRQMVGRFGRPVQYMITLPKGWEAFKFSGPAQGAALETIFKKKEATAKAANTAAEAQKKAQQNTAAPTKDSFVAVDPNLTVTQVLDVIFSQTLDVLKLGNFTHSADQDGNIRFYKHLITVTSDDQSFTVHVDIVEFVVPNVDLNAKSNAVNSADSDLYTDEPMPDGTRRRAPKQFIEYDYIFSGTNLDVLQLDLKIENLNFLLMQGTKLGAGAVRAAADDAQKQTDGDGVVHDKRPVFGLRQKDPFLVPQRTQGERTNFNNLSANTQIKDGEDTPQAVNQQYTRNLQAFYSLGPVDAKLSLRGNPDLMLMVSLQALPAHVSGATITAKGELSETDLGVKAKYRVDFERDLLKLNGAPIDNPSSPINSRILSGRNFVSSPVFMKVNVFGPNVDYKTNEPIAGGDYSQKLFFDNFYLVDRVISKIEHTKFTQDIAIRSFSVFTFPSTTVKGAASSTVKEVKARDHR